MSHLLTVQEAARRVRRTVRTIEYWIADKERGLPVIWIGKRRHIALEPLLAELKYRNARNPANRWGRDAAEDRTNRVISGLERKYAPRHAQQKKDA